MYRNRQGQLHKTTEELLKNTVFMNGLESKICLKTYKAHYVEETEDMFVRLNGSTVDAEDLRRKRSRRFAHVLATKAKASATPQVNSA